MTGREFSDRALGARLQAEQEHLAAFAAAWRDGIEEAAGLLSVAVTADADWQPPHGDPLQTAAFVALIARLSARIGALRLASLRTLATSLRIRPTSLNTVGRQESLTGTRLREAVGGELQRLTRQAHAEGLSVTDAARTIEQGIADVAPARADMLARTELNALANQASLAAAREAGIKFKGWISARDPRVRDPHEAADGHIVPVADQFTVCGGQRCDAPGDPVLSDDCLCNCRCTLLYGQTLAELQGLLASAAPTSMTAMATASKSTRPAARRSAAERGDDPLRTAAAVIPDEAPVEALTAAARALPFSGVAAVEGLLSDDNTPAPRVLLPNSLSWPELPVPLMAQTVTAEGHDGAAVAGRIDRFTRSREKQIGFKGELTTPYGVDEIAPMIEDKTLRFVSIDLGASQFELVHRDTFKVVADDEASLEDMQAGKYALGLVSGKIKAATLVPTPALGGTEVALTASADGTEATLTFSADLAFGTADEPVEDAELDRAIGTLRSVLGLAAELESERERAQRLAEQMQASERDGHQQLVDLIDSMTQRIAQGDEKLEVLTSAVEALVSQRNEPRRIEVEKDEQGRTIAYVER